MGIEQGTPVTGSTIDLLRNIDLPDLRLPRAFQAWTEFKTRHEPQVATIGTLPLDQVVALGNELSVLIGQAIGMEAIDQSKHIDEPLENPIHIGTYLMAKRARELGIKSILTGDGSDEFFLGYERIACWLNGSSSNPNATYLKLLSTMQPDEATELYKDDAVALTEPIVDSFNRPIEPFRDIDQVLLFERLDHLSEYHNMRIDRMTMAHGVEARVPFEDHRLVEFSLHIPITTLFGTSAKEWLGQVARPWVPGEIINRQKVHFPSLPDQWLSGEGAKWTAEILLDNGAQTRKWIKHSVLDRYINEHKNNEYNHGRLLWALMVLELWLQNLSSWRNAKKD